MWVYSFVSSETTLLSTTPLYLSLNIYIFHNFQTLNLLLQLSKILSLSKSHFSFPLSENTELKNSIPLMAPLDQPPITDKEKYVAYVEGLFFLIFFSLPLFLNSAYNYSMWMLAQPYHPLM